MPLNGGMIFIKFLPKKEQFNCSFFTFSNKKRSVKKSEGWGVESEDKVGNKVAICIKNIDKR